MSQGQPVVQSQDQRVLLTRGTFHSISRGQFPFGLASPRLPDMSTTLSHDYDQRVAYLLSVVSAWVYSDGQTLADKLQYYGFPAGTTVEEMPVVNDALLVVATAFLIRSADRRVGILAFRGTEPSNVINWLTDADTTLRPFHGGRIHSGFYANVEALWGYIDQKITAAMGSQNGNGHGEGLRTLYITGHSLGAAMAVIAAARIFTPEYADWQPLVMGVYTFGQPMVGDAEFARQSERRFGPKLFRHVYRHDVVPRLPPWSTGDFAHFGEERFSPSPDAPWITSARSRVKQSPFASATTLIAMGAFFARRLRFLQDLHLWYSLDDHSPERYIEVCRASLSA
jgi:hypothetical protein